MSGEIQDLIQEEKKVEEKVHEAELQAQEIIKDAEAKAQSIIAQNEQDLEGFLKQNTSSLLEEIPKKKEAMEREYEEEIRLLRESAKKHREKAVKLIVSLVLEEE